MKEIKTNQNIKHIQTVYVPSWNDWICRICPVSIQFHPPHSIPTSNRFPDPVIQSSKEV